MRRVDVAIVGAGPAGTAAALFLSGHGLQVQLIDRAVFPRDKVCGEALSPGALPFLERFGLLDELERQGAFPYRGARLVTSDGLVAEATYPSTTYGLAMPRERLDWLLFERASHRVDVQEGLSVETIVPRDGGLLLSLKGQARHEALWARTVLSAEGRFARLLGSTSREPGLPSRFAVVATLEGVEALEPLLEFHLLDPTFQVVVSPQAAERAAIALVLDGPDASRRAPEAIKDFMGVLRRDPLLAGRIRSARLLKPPRGMGLGRYRPADLVGDGWLMVGDAVGSMDPITGEGMYRAFRTAELAAETLKAAFSRGAFRACHLAPYARSVRREFTPSYRFVDTVVTLSRHPRLARFALRAIAQDPVLAGRMGSYQGALASAAGFFSLDTLARLAWGACRPSARR